MGNGVSTPVFYSPHSLIARKHPPGFMILGSPGKGKSYLAFSLVTGMTLSGALGIFIDPKADAASMTHVPGVPPDSVNLFSVADGGPGLLDIFAMKDGDQDAAITLALDIMRTIMGDRTFDKYKTTIITALDEMLKVTPNPCLNDLITYLDANSVHGSIENDLMIELSMYARQKYANLLFGKRPEGSKPMPILPTEKGHMTVVTLLGISLPKAAKSDTSQYSLAERIGLAILQLVLHEVESIMTTRPKSWPKFVFVDESWRVTSTPGGLEVLDALIRLGRSHFCAVGLASQNGDDIYESGLLNSIPTRFMFGMELDEDKDVQSARKILGVNSPEVEGTLRTMPTGYCIIRDADRRACVMRVLSPPDWGEAFNTNPLADKIKQIEG